MTFTIIYHGSPYLFMPITKSNSSTSKKYSRRKETLLCPSHTGEMHPQNVVIFVQVTSGACDLLWSFPYPERWKVQKRRRKRRKDHINSFTFSKKHNLIIQTFNSSIYQWKCILLIGH